MTANDYCEVWKPGTWKEGCIRKLRNEDSIWSAIFRLDLPALKCILEKEKIDSRLQNYYVPALYFAVVEGSLDVVAYLVEIVRVDACASLQDKEVRWFPRKFYFAEKACIGKKPLHVAVCHGQLEIVKFFIKKGMDINLRDADGMTPLHYAAVCGKDEILDHLLQNGADLSAKDNGGRSVLHAAIWGEQLSTIEYLSDKRADLNCSDHQGQTPLHYAQSVENKADQIIGILNFGARRTSPYCNDDSKSEHITSLNNSIRDNEDSSQTQRKNQTNSIDRRRHLAHLKRNFFQVAS